MNGKRLRNFNAAEQVARDEVEIVTARLMSQLGFTHGTHYTIDVVSDVAVRYLRKLCQNVRLVSEHGGRVSVAIKDVQLAYKRLQIDTEELNEYMRQNRPLSPRMIPEFPAIPPKIVSKTTQIAPSAPQPEYFPPWAPPIYVSEKSTVASSSRESLKHDYAIFPDFTKFSALSLGIQRYKPTINTRECVSRVSSSIGQADSRPSSRSSVTNAPMFKRRKRKREDQISPNITNAAGPSSAGVPAVATVSQSTKIFTAKDLAYNHRPVMIAIHTRGCDPPQSRPPPLPKVPSTLTHDDLNMSFNQSMSPRRIVQLAVLRSLFTLDSELPNELSKAFDYIEDEPVQNTAPGSAILLPAAPPSSEPVYRIIPQDPPPTDLPPGTLPPLKIRISRASVSGDPSPVISQDSLIGSPQPKRHKHKKKKHKKSKHEEEVLPPQELPSETPRPAIRLKIRLGTT